MHRWCLLLACSLLVCAAPAWAGGLKGAVIDEEGVPLFGVQISVSGTDVVAFTDENGEYQLPALPAGEVKLTFFTDGYREKEITVQTPEEGDLVLDVQMELAQETYIGDELVVTGQTPIDQSPQTSAHTFTREEIEDNAGAFQDITKAIQQLPGIVSDTDFTSDMYVRGSQSWENLIVLDGQLLANPYHFGVGLSIINTDLVDQFTFYAAGFPAQYPFATGSVLDVTYRDGNRDHVDGELDVSMLSASAVATGPAGDKITWILSGRRSYYDYMLRLLDWTDVPIPVFSDALLRGSYEPNDMHRFVLLVMRNQDGARASIDEENPSVVDEGSGYYEQITQVYGLDYKFLPLSWFFSRTMLSYQIINADGSITSTTDSFYGKAQVNGFYINQEVQFDVGRQVIKGGGVYGRVDLDAGARFPLSEYVPGARFANEQTTYTIEFSDDKPKVLYGFYLQHEAEVIPNRLRTNIGSRLDRYMATKRGWVFGPRASMSTNLAAHSVLKVAWGVYYMPPYASFMTDEDLGNPNLRSEKSTHYVVGLEQGLGEQMMLRVESYYKDFEDQIYQTLSPNSDLLDQLGIVMEGEIPQIDYANSGYGKAMGVEVFFQKKLSGWWDGWLAYSFGEVRYNDGQGRFGWYYPMHDQRHTLALVANFRPLENWVFSGSFRLTSGRPYTEVEGWTEAFPETFFRYWQANNGELNAARFPFYHRLDLRIERTWRVHPRIDLTAFFEVYNVYNQRNLWGYYYENEEGLEKPKRQPIYQLPIIPFAGVKSTFL